MDRRPTLNEDVWIGAGGLTPEWRAVFSARTADTLARLRPAAAAARGRWSASLGYFLRQGGPERERLLGHPGLDYWLFLWENHFTQPRPEEDWHLHLGQFSGFAAALALARGDALECEASLDPNGRFPLFGTPYTLVYPLAQAKEPLHLRLLARQLDVEGPGGSRARLKADALGLRFTTPPTGPIRLEKSLELSGGIVIDDKSWLLLHGATMHGLASLDEKSLKRFQEVLATALREMRESDPEFHAELTDMLRLLIPLANPMKFGSVSSSYVNLRGAICLSHSEDALLQAETLIHEFSHQKMNQLLSVESVLKPGQSGQVFYSPWRKDARRLRGLLLGAHAFLNVCRYLLKRLSLRGFQKKEDVDVMLNIALRLPQIEMALRSLSFYADFTPFGERFLKGLWRELGLLTHGTLWFPRGVLRQAQTKTAGHRRRFALFDTGFHKNSGFIDRVDRAPFLTPGGREKTS